MKTLTFLLSTVIELYTMLFLLRIWIHLAKCDFYNPFSQFVVNITNPIIGRLYSFFSKTRKFDIISLFAAFIFSIFKAIILFMVITFRPVIWFSAFLILLKTTGSLIFWILLLTSVVSWANQGYSQVEYVLIQLIEPLLSPIRNILPSIGDVDFSPMVFIFFLYILNMGIGEILQLTGNILLYGLWVSL